jgi:hypothetical protein
MRPSISGFLRLLSHHVVLGDAGGQRRHRLGVRQLLVRVHEAYGGLGAEHRVVALLSVDQLQLVEFHVLRPLLNRSFSLQQLLLQTVN